METIENTLTPEEIEHKRQYLIDEVNKGIDSPRDPRPVDQIFEDVRRECLEKWQSNSALKQV